MRTRPAAGFTLFEVLMAVAVLSVAMLAVLRGGIFAREDAGQAAYMTQASLAASNGLAAMAVEGAAGALTRSGNVQALPGAGWKSTLEPLDTKPVREGTLERTDGKASTSTGRKSDADMVRTILADCRLATYRVFWEGGEVAVEGVLCGE